MSAAGVQYVSAIQTSTYYRWDNRFSADLSKANGEYMADVLTLDPDDLHRLGMLVIVQTSIATPANQCQHSRYKAEWKDWSAWEAARCCEIESVKRHHPAERE